MHVAVNCTDLHKSLDFYRAFFGAEPSKVKENYAKFELDNPALQEFPVQRKYTTFLSMSLISFVVQSFVN